MMLARFVLTIVGILLLGRSDAQPMVNALPADREAAFYPAGTRVLLIGVSNYAEKTFPTLRGEDDALQIGGLFRARGVPKTSITLLRSPKQPSDIIDAIEALHHQLDLDLQKQRGGDATQESFVHGRVVIYFAGHGYSLEHVGYLVPSAAADPLQDPNRFRSSALRVEDLLEHVRELPVEHALVLLDSCFSGLGLHALPRDEFPEPPRPADRRAKVLQVITAGTASEKVDDSGMFAKFLMLGLNGAADLNFDGWITGTELGMYLRLRIAGESALKQTPTFGNILPADDAGFSKGENWFASVQAVPQRIAQADDPAELSQSFRDCRDCPPMRVVPGQAGSREVPDPYIAMSRTEVTFDEFDACFRAGFCRRWPVAAFGARGRQPVTDVSWHDAKEYTKWLTCVTQKRYRLPRESEWRQVAAPESDRLHRWRAQGLPLANCANCGSPWDGHEPAPVGSFPPSDLGLFDLIGNVWEWMEDCASPGRPDCDRAADDSCCRRRVVGGAYTTRYSVAESLPGGDYAAATRDRNLGFRVVRDLGAPAPTLTCAPQFDEP